MNLTFTGDSGQRLDAYLAANLSDLSRSRIQNLIKEGHILLNGQKVKARTALKSGDSISVTIPEVEKRTLVAQDLPLNVLHEDDDLIVLDKEPGMVVHPAAGNEDGTLVNALLHHCAGRLALDGGEDRPGIVHRLDKDTSGCLVAAKTDTALKHLAAQFADRSTVKLYLAVAQSPLKSVHQTVFNHIARHPIHRQRMDVCNPGSGKPAITDLHLLHEAEDGTSLVLCALHTGRTHQIRVHHRFLGHPLLGDPIYSKPARQVRKMPRLMLHAWRLGITHPTTGLSLQNEAAIPQEFHPWTHQVRDKLEMIRDLETKDGLHTFW